MPAPAKYSGVWVYQGGSSRLAAFSSELSSANFLRLVEAFRKTINNKELNPWGMAYYVDPRVGDFEFTGPPLWVVDSDPYRLRTELDRDVIQAMLDQIDLFREGTLDLPENRRSKIVSLMGSPDNGIICVVSIVPKPILPRATKIDQPSAST